MPPRIRGAFEKICSCDEKPVRGSGVCGRVGVNLGITMFVLDRREMWLTVILATDCGKNLHSIPAGSLSENDLCLSRSTRFGVNLAKDFI